MGTLYATDRDGTEHQLGAKPGLSLMEILRDAGLPVEAICGGQCICSTCHIYVDPQWQDNWESKIVRPSLVRLKIALTDAPWPDLAVAVAY